MSISGVDVSLVGTLSAHLQSRDAASHRQYRGAVARALAMPSCRLVPFFGTFLHDVRAVLANVPAIVVFPSNAQHSLEVVTFIIIFGTLAFSIYFAIGMMIAHVAV